MEAKEKLRKARQKLGEEKQAIVELETFYEEVKAQWSDIELRSIGHVHYSPSIFVGVEGKRYTEDWDTFEVVEAKFNAHFQRNVVDLGAF